MFVLNNTSSLYTVALRLGGRGVRIQLTPGVKKEVDAEVFEALKSHEYIASIMRAKGENAFTFGDEPIQVVKVEVEETKEKDDDDLADTVEMKKPPVRKTRRKKKKETDDEDIF